jgi:hypothetical protein
MKKKTLFTGILSLALVFGMLLFVGCPTEDDGGSNTGGDNTGGDNTGGDNTGGDNTGGDNTGGDTTGKNITVYMEKPAGWSQLYAYVWDDSGKEFTATTPGTALTTASSGFYSYQAQSAENDYINVRFSDGGSNATLDILGVDSNTYYKSLGTFSTDSSKVRLNASTNGTFTAPTFKTSEVTDKTITLTWGVIPEADDYVLYDEFSEYDDDGHHILDSEYWHFQNAFSKKDTSFLDDNYGQKLDPEWKFKWKLIAVRYKDGIDVSTIEDLGDMSEEEFSAYYTPIYDYGELEARTAEGTLPAPQNLRVTEVDATSVALSWDPVNVADYYMVWWWDEEEGEWNSVETAYDPEYIDADESFIFPNSTYKYKVEARTDEFYGKRSLEVSATTSAEALNIAATSPNTQSIARAVSQWVKPATPNSVSLKKDKSGKIVASQLDLKWNSSLSGKYKIGLFTSSTTQTPYTTMQSSGSSLKTHTFTGIPGAYTTYYVRVMRTTTDKTHTDSDWSDPSGPAVVFPGITAVADRVTPDAVKGTKVINVTITPSNSAINYSSIKVTSDKAGKSSISGAQTTGSGNSYKITVKTSGNVYIHITPKIGSTAGNVITIGPK